MNNTMFDTEPGFCPKCGSILPLLGEKGGVECYLCKENYTPEIFGDMKVKYSVPFNATEKDKTKIRKSKNIKTEEEEEEGPVVERRCPKCGNERMSYATLQLRSADEGQTVFYTCTKCKFKETENS